MIRTPRARPLTIVYSHTSGLVGGGNVVLLRLFSKLDRRLFNPISVIPEHGPLEARLKALDVPYRILDLRPTPRARIATASVIARLFLFGQKTRPDVVHSNDPYTYRLLSQICPSGRRLCHIHHPAVDKNSIGWSFQRVPTAVAVPTDVVADLVHRGLAETRPRISNVPVHIVGNPIDTDWFSPASDVRQLKSRLGIPPDQPHVSLVASLSKHKGQECFLRMARQICDRIPDVTFSIVGGVTSDKKEYADSLVALSGALGLSDRVRFWGYVEDVTARDIVAASDLFVLPTKEEGFGLVLAEAQACGVPVLTSTIPPLAEIVSDGTTGYLLDSDDDQAFAARALNLLGNPEQRGAMGRAGRAFVVERFGSDAFAQRLTTIYERLAS